MNNLLIALLTASLVTGCATKPRQGPPAPVTSAGDRGAQSTSQPAPKNQAVDTYAYRPPGEPTTSPADASHPAEGGATGMKSASGVDGSTPAHATARPPALPANVDPGLAPAITWTPPTTSPAGRTATPHAAAAGTAHAQAPGPATETMVATAGPRHTPATQAPAAASPGASAPKTSTTPPSSGATAPQTVAKYAAPSPAVPQLSAAAASLAAQAEKQRESGDYVAAAATLERAIRIQPQEAYLWNRLARVRLDQNNYAQAGSLAQKSNTLAKDQGQIKRDNWGMIATTRRATGDQKGAQEAEAKAGGQ